MRAARSLAVFSGSTGSGFRQRGATALLWRSALVAPFTVAFQPILDIEACRVFAHEALVRGEGCTSTEEVLMRMSGSARYGFDRLVRFRAIDLAIALGVLAPVSVNVMSNGIVDFDSCLAPMVSAMREHGRGPDQLIVEFTEAERIASPAMLASLVRRCREEGVRTAFDDFGAGFAGLGLLAQVQPDILKLDRVLIGGIHTDPVRRKMIAAIVRMADGLNIRLVAEGIETRDELLVFEALEISLVQGFLIRRPMIGHGATETEIAHSLETSITA